MFERMSLFIIIIIIIIITIIIIIIIILCFYHYYHRYFFVLVLRLNDVSVMYYFTVLLSIFMINADESRMNLFTCAFATDLLFIGIGFGKSVRILGQP